MPKFQPKIQQQMKAIFALAKKRGIEMDDDMRCDLARRVSGDRVQSLAQISFDEANGLIKHFGGEPMPFHAKPRRTENYQKQQAGVVTIVTKTHLEKLDQLAADRGMSAEGLERMCYRMLRQNRPLTATGCNAVIEAIKAMNERDRVRSSQKEAA